MNNHQTAPEEAAHKKRTLILCTGLHAFTHLYQVALLPLYFLIQKDLRLASVEKATLLVTVMMLAYFLPSYLMGILADRYSRKNLLALGLAINAIGFIALARAPDFGAALAAIVVAGIGGSFFHPAATALIAGLYPAETGRALGLLGSGAGVGFFVGPLYTGWRATSAGWRSPVLELGAIGLAGALAFWWLAEEKAPARPDARTLRQELFPSAALWVLFIGAALAFSFRDFAGTAMASLSSLFLQQAHGFTLKETGTALSIIFLAAIISNPVFGRLSDRGRFRWAILVLTLAALMVMVFPRLPGHGHYLALPFYGFFFMASFPMVEAALMEAVPNEVRGRVFGFFITIGGFLGNLGHWQAGQWVKKLGPTSARPEAYYGMFFLLGLFILISLFGLRCLRGIREQEQALSTRKDESHAAAA